MHKDPPPTLFDARRPLSHVISHGLIAGFVVSVVTHFGWTLSQQHSADMARRPAGTDALVSGINAQTAPTSPSPTGASR